MTGAAAEATPPVELAARALAVQRRDQLTEDLAICANRPAAAARGDLSRSLAVVQQREVLELAMNQDWTGLETTLNQIAQDQAAAMTDEQRAALGDVGALVKQQIAAQLQIFQSPWYQFFLRHDPGQDWTQVTVPVLGIFGARDTQVDAEQNSAALQAALDQAGNSDVTITVLPAANHLFQEAGTGGVDEYAALPPQLMPEFLEAISQWLLERVQAPS